MEPEPIVSMQQLDNSPLPFFDGKWYLQANKDVREAAVPPFDHYKESGWKEGRAPCPGFFELMGRYFPEVPCQENFISMWASLRNDRPAAVAKFMRDCIILSRDYKILQASSLWDGKYYVQNYPDIRKGGIDPAIHYLLAGFSERRNPSAIYIGLNQKGRFKDCPGGECPVIWYETSGIAKDPGDSSQLLPCQFQNSSSELNLDPEYARKMIESPLISHVSFPAIGALLKLPGLDYGDLLRLAYLPLAGPDTESLVSFRSDSAKLGLDAAYWAMTAHFDLPLEDANQLREAEWNAWLALLQPDPDFLELLKTAAAAGKKIIIIDDFFFNSAEIFPFLSKNRIPAINHIYTFHDTGRIKGSGRLYAHALESEKICASCLLHIGSNLRDDYLAPIGQSIPAFFLQAEMGLDRPAAQSKLDLADRIVLGYAAYRKQGYLAPLQLGCALAIANFVKHHATDFYFCEDAGDACRHVYNILASGMGLPKAGLCPFLYEELEFISYKSLSNALQSLPGRNILQALKRLLGADFNVEPYLPQQLQCYIIDDVTLPILLAHLDPHLPNLDHHLYEKQLSVWAAIQKALPEGKGVVFASSPTSDAARVLENISGGRFTLLTPDALTDHPNLDSRSSSERLYLLDALLSAKPQFPDKLYLRAFGIKDFCLAFEATFQPFMSLIGAPDSNHLFEAFMGALRHAGGEGLDRDNNISLPDRLCSERIPTLKTRLSLSLEEPDPFAGTGFSSMHVHIKVPPPRFAGSASPGRIGIHLHLHHRFLYQEMLRYLASFPYRFDLFITTTSSAPEFNVIFNRGTLSKAGKVEIIQTPNQGRDIAPWILGMRPFQDKYDFFAHIHGKVSSYCPYGAKWRQYLLERMLTPGQVGAVFDCFYVDKDLGVMFPEPMPELVEELSQRRAPMLTRNIQFGLIRNLLDRMGIPEPFLLSDLFYSLGSMYWYRPLAVSQLFQFPLQLEEFPPEPFPMDQTIAHAIERIVPFIGQHNGFKALAYDFS